MCLRLGQPEANSTSIVCGVSTCASCATPKPKSTKLSDINGNDPTNNCVPRSLWLPAFVSSSPRRAPGRFHRRAEVTTDARSHAGSGAGLFRTAAKWGVRNSVPVISAIPFYFGITFLMARMGLEITCVTLLGAGRCRSSSIGCEWQVAEASRSDEPEEQRLEC